MEPRSEVKCAVRSEAEIAVRTFKTTPGAIEALCPLTLRIMFLF